MAQPKSYLDLLRDLSMSPDEKNNAIKIKGYRHWQNYFSTAEKLKDLLRGELEQGDVKAAEIQAAIDRFNSRFRPYVFEGRSYRVHDSFKFNNKQARFVVTVHQFYQPILNYNNELLSLSKHVTQTQNDLLSGKDGQVLQEEFVLGMRIQIKPINFFSIFQELARLKFNGMDIVKLENKRAISRCLSLFCADHNGKQISARTIEKYLKESTSTSTAPSNPPYLKVSISDK